MQATIRLNNTLNAVISSSLSDEQQARHQLVSARKHTHSVQESERLDIALKQAVGFSRGLEQLGIRRRAFVTLQRQGVESAKPAGVAQWYLGLRELITCEGAFLKADITLEAFWCEPLAAEAGLATEFAATVAEDIAQEVAALAARLKEEFPDAVTLWTIDAAPAAYHVADELKLEVSVALMNEVYGPQLNAMPLAA